MSDDYELSDALVAEYSAAAVATVRPDMHALAVEVQRSRAELAALKARRCDGCRMAMPGGNGYESPRPGYLWCLLPNVRQDATAPVVFPVDSLGLTVSAVRPDHACNAWTAKVDG